MSDGAMVLRLAGYQLLSLRRNSRAVVFTIAFPVVLFVLFASVFGHGSQSTGFQGGRIALDAYFLAGMIAYAIAMAAFSTLAISLTTQRESGLLKRYRGTPMPAWTFIAALVVRSILLVVLETAALLVIGAVAYDVTVSGPALAELAVYVVLGTFTMATLGVSLTAIARTADSAATIAPFTVLLLSFISGVFIPVSQLPNSLVQIGKVFPLAHLAEGLQDALLSHHLRLDAENFAVLAIWGIAGLIVAQRAFRWTPQAVGAGA